jgi:hypothetical protein
MAHKELPLWAVRLRQERTRRLWSQKATAIRLRDAADEQTRAVLPAIDSIQRYVRDYEAGKHFPGDLYSELYCRAFGLTRETLFGMPPSTQTCITRSDQVLTEYDARSLTSWITATNTSDAAISDIGQAVSLLAEIHTQRPPAQLLSEVVRLHHRIQGLLRMGKQRLSQTRDLSRFDADLLAHASLLLGDLHSNEAAAAHGSAARLYAQEADANQAVAFSVQAKTQRWRLRFADSADLARRGFECSPPTPIRILLASQEANAAALLGDVRRAGQALGRAEDAAGGPIAADSGISAWSCPRPRQALFALSVATRSGDPDAAMRAAEMADSAWASGDPWVAGTWAQVRLGAGIAHIMKGDLDGALEEITPVLALAPEFRMATITGYTSHMDRRLRQRRFQGDITAMEIRQKIQEFNSAALSDAQAGSGDT